MLIAVFSRDRALQLEATLSSLRRHCADLSDARFLIVYKATDSRHELQYAELAGELGDLSVDLVPERRFRADLLTGLLARMDGPVGWQSRVLVAASARSRLPSTLLERSLRRDHADELIFFLVDDNIFVRDFTFREVAAALRRRPAAIGFSLRLGTNTTNCYAFDETQEVPDFEQVTPRVLEYAWPEAERDFGYPLEVSSSVYRAHELVPVLLGLRFHSPNTLESGLASVAPRLAPERPRLLCFRSSVTFCNPINKVQTEYANRSSDDETYGTEELADLFDAGYRIDVEQYNGLTPSGVHHEVPLELTRA
jgi:hypothetical protein